MFLKFLGNQITYLFGFFFYSEILVWVMMTSVAIILIKKIVKIDPGKFEKRVFEINAFEVSEDVRDQSEYKNLLSLNAVF